MIGAGGVVYSATVFTRTMIPGGAASAPATLEAMRRMVYATLAQAPVWEVTTAALAGVGPDPGARAAAVNTWLRAHFHYLPDPLDMELLTDPTVHALGVQGHGVTFGDCDDAAVFGAAMGKAAGLPAKLVAVAYRPHAPLSHVYTTLRTPRGWAILDVTIPPQGPTPMPRRRLEVKV